MLARTNILFRSSKDRHAFRSFSAGFPQWATADPARMGLDEEPHAVSNLAGGQWMEARSRMVIPHPLDKDARPIFTIPDTQVDELGPFLESLRRVPKSGVHNPIKSPERYVQYGEIARRVSSLRNPETSSIMLILLLLPCSGWRCSKSTRCCRVFHSMYHEMCTEVSWSSHG